LIQNPKVWVTEILWKVLIDHTHIHDARWIIGGDLNSSETFDYQKKNRPRGNFEIIERMNAIGLFDALRSYHQRLVPTYKNNSGGEIIHQLDHLYMSKCLLDVVSDCQTGSHKDVFESKLSDHLPIIASVEI
jgi:hypothetical protein